MTDELAVPQTPELKCDFCVGPDSYWRYLLPEGFALYMVVESMGAKGELLKNSGGIAACKECAEIIDSNDHEKACRLMFKRMVANARVLQALTPEQRQRSREGYVKIYARIIRNSTGREPQTKNPHFLDGQPVQYPERN